jgi:hypothetical protein
MWSVSVISTTSITSETEVSVSVVMRPESRGNGCEASDAGQPVSGVEAGHVAVGGGEQFGSQQRPEIRHAHDDGGESVPIKRLIDHGVDVSEFGVEVDGISG